VIGLYTIFFKQLGGFRPKSGGRKINGRTYSQYPKISNMSNILKEIEFNEKEFSTFCNKILKQK